MADDIPIIHGFYIGQLLDKTIMAARKVYIYRNAAAGETPVGYVEAGQPIGVLYSWFAPDFSQNRDRYWLQFYPPNDYSYYYVVPFNDGDFDWSSLQQQGAITVIQQQEQAEKEKQEAETPFYEKIAKWFAEGLKGDIVKPIVTAGVVIGAVYVGAVYVLPAVMKAFDKGGKKKK